MSAQRYRYDGNLPQYFDSGYASAIRGQGYGYTNTHVFPGTQQIGNEAGANGPLYAQNPDRGFIVIVNRAYGPSRAWDSVFPR